MSEELLSGPRITLRPFQRSDSAAVAEACRDSDIPRFTFMPESMTAAQAAEWIDCRRKLTSKGLHAFAITLPPDDRCLGQMGVQIDRAHRRAEAFYWLDQRARGRGLATEALDVVTRWAFEKHDVVRAHLITNLDNTASQRVAKNCGYQREGILRAWEPIKNGQPDVEMWSRLVSDPVPDLRQ